MSNYKAGSGSRVRPDEYYLDKLPRRLRLALCGAAFNWDSKWFYDRWQKGKSVDSLIREVQQWDKNKAARPEKVRVAVGKKWREIPTPITEHKVPVYYDKAYI